MTPFVRLPVAAAGCATTTAELGAVLWLYLRADAARWAPLELSSRYMVSETDLSRRAADGLVSRLQGAGLVEILDPGSSQIRQSRILRVLPPEEISAPKSARKPVIQSVIQSAGQQNDDIKPVLAISDPVRDPVREPRITRLNYQTELPDSLLLRSATTTPSREEEQIQPPATTAESEEEEENPVSSSKRTLPRHLAEPLMAAGIRSLEELACYSRGGVAGMAGLKFLQLEALEGMLRQHGLSWAGQGWQQTGGEGGDAAWEMLLAEVPKRGRMAIPGRDWPCEEAVVVALRAAGGWGQLCGLRHPGEIERMKRGFLDAINQEGRKHAAK